MLILQTSFGDIGAWTDTEDECIVNRVYGLSKELTVCLLAVRQGKLSVLIRDVQAEDNLCSSRQVLSAGMIRSDKRCGDWRENNGYWF